MQTKSLVDHISTNEPHMIQDSGIVLSDLSDDFLIFVCNE